MSFSQDLLEKKPRATMSAAFYIFSAKGADPTTYFRLIDHLAQQTGMFAYAGREYARRTMKDRWK